MKLTNLSLITLLIFCLNKSFASDPLIRLSIDIIGELPESTNLKKNPGVAGAFSGIINNKLIIAGGSNFPYKTPWEGGEKIYHNTVYIFEIHENNIQFIDSTQHLPYPVAYGSSINLPNGILCIAGNNSESCFSQVFSIQLDDATNKLSFQNYPDLPTPLSFASAELINNNVYVIGGSSSAGGIEGTNHFYRLDLTKENTLDFTWEILPAYPGNSRIYSVSAVQSNGVRECIYLFSGRNISNDKKISVFKDGLVYDPIFQKWDKVNTNDSIEFPVMAGSAYSLGTSDILFLGGATGDLILKEQRLKSKLAEAISNSDTSKVSELQSTLIYNLENHPGFSKDILLYNTITNTLSMVGTFKNYCPVTTNIVPWQNGVLISSGEIKPGIRTPEIINVRIEQKTIKFGWLNYVMLAIYFLMLIGVGFIFSKKQKSTEDYFKGGGRVPWWAAGLSIFGTALSAITFMAIPAKTYSTDWSYFLLNMAIFLVAPVITTLFIPFYRRLNITTAYEYLEKRFNVIIRLLGSISFILFQIGRMGIILLLPSLALNVVTGIDVFLCILLMGVVSLIYTLMGGIEAVIWTDVIQVIVLLSGAIVALFLMYNSIDTDLKTILHTVSESQKINLFDLRMTLREPTVWVMLIGGGFIYTTTYGTDQTMVQRYLTTQTEKEAKQSVWTNAWLTIPATILFFSIGTMLFIFYKHFPLENNATLENFDGIFPWYIATQLPNGLSGLLIAGIFAAAMSSLSSSMNSGATAYATDIHFRFSLTSSVSQLKIARIATLLIGLSGTLFAVLMATWNIQSLWDEFNKLLGLIIGSLGGLFLLGLLSKKANSSGALVGLFVSILVQILVSNYHVFHLLMYTASGVTSCFVFGWLGSLLFPGKKENQEELTIHRKNNN